MTQNTRNLLTLTLISLVAAGFLFGSGSTYYWQKTGEPTTATVTRCTTQRKAQVCRGTWMAKDGFHMGIIENANSGDLDQRIEVRAWGERAIKPGLRLPIILLVLGLGIAGLGALWWIREAPRERKPKPDGS